MGIATSGIQFDWTINLGTLIAALIFVGGLVAAFTRLQSRVENLKSELHAQLGHFQTTLDQFNGGLKEFKQDFKQLGGQVVAALISIARLEGKAAAENGSHEEEGAQRSLLAEIERRQNGGR